MKESRLLRKAILFGTKAVSNLALIARLESTIDNGMNRGQMSVKEMMKGAY